MGLSDYTENPGGRLSDGDKSFFDVIPPLYYLDTGEPFTGTPKTVVFSDPVLYYDETGRELVEWERLIYNMTWTEYTIPLEKIKSYLKVEHNLEDDLISLFTAAAIQKVATRLNRGFDKVPADVELAIYKIIAYWYENRNDQNTIPAEAEELLAPYYRMPGL